MICHNLEVHSHINVYRCMTVVSAVTGELQQGEVISPTECAAPLQQLAVFSVWQHSAILL
jgi:hypothetical protein